MNAIQLEFNIDDASPDEHRLTQMQRQIDAACDSMGKVRRRMFHELGAMKQAVIALQAENEALKHKLRELCNERQEWSYEKEGCLFAERV